MVRKKKFEILVGMMENIRNQKCAFPIEKEAKGKTVTLKYLEFCDKEAPNLYLVGKEWPICFCDEHDKIKFDKYEEIIQSETEPISHEEFDVAVVLKY